MLYKTDATTIENELCKSNIFSI